MDENLTYDYLHSSEDNLWRILYLTEDLTSVRTEDLSAPLPDGLSALMIPNAEILEIFESTIVKWFDGLMTMPKPGIARIFFMLSGMLTAKPDP